LELGFLDCGISEASFLADEKDWLTSWLQQEMHGEMAYIANHLDKRLDHRLLVENARSVISFCSIIFLLRNRQIRKHRYSLNMPMVLIIIL